MDFIRVESEVVCGGISIPLLFEASTELLVDYNLSTTYLGMF